MEKIVNEPLKAPSLPSVQEVANLSSLSEGVRLCELSHIDYGEAENVLQLKETLLRFLKDKGVRGSSRPVLAVADQSMRELNEKKVKFQCLVNDIRDFVNDSDILPLLRILLMTESSTWMSDDDFEKFKERCTNEKPIFLVLGSTSSGKSTLINAMIGTPLLPTSHNAATSTFYEIKYGLQEKAVLHYETQCEETGDVLSSTEALDLQKESDRKRFAALRIKGEKQTKAKLKKAEVSLPFQFLETLTVIDSPGVDEDVHLLQAQDVIEFCQSYTVCGFICVVDATRAAEVGGQIADVLAAIAQRTDSPPPADSALFVVNKWDRFLDQYQGKEEKKVAADEYLEELCKQLQSRWQGFERQKLIVINSKLAQQVQELGEMTSDMSCLCDGISKALPQGMKNMIQKALKRPIELLDEIERRTDSAFRLMKLPEDQRKLRQDDNAKRFQKFHKSFESGSMATLRRRFSEAIDSFTVGVVKSMRHEESIENSTRVDRPSDISKFSSMLDTNLKTAIRESLHKTIAEHNKKMQDLNSNLGSRVEEEFQRLLDFSSSVGLTPAKDDASLSFQTSEINAEKVSRAKIFGLALAFPLLLALAPILVWVYVIGSFHKERKFRLSFKSAYVEELKKILSSDSNLRDRVKRAVIEENRSAQIVYEDFEQRLKAIKKHLAAAQNCQFQERETEFNQLRGKCQCFIGCAYLEILKLGVQRYTKADFTWPSTNMTEGGNFGVVHKAKLAGKDFALKEFKSAIDKTNAQTFFRELTAVRNLTGKSDYVVKFFGLVLMEQEPLKLGLAFEWCDGGTLENEITGSISARKLGGFVKAKRFLYQILLGLEFLHGEQLVHRDIKPKNILLTTDKNVKIADFGTAKKIDEITGTYQGTTLHMAPEVVRSDPYGPPADIYSVGIIMWELWHGQTAFAENLSSNRPLTPTTHMRLVEEEIRPRGFAPAEGQDQDVADQWQRLMVMCWATQSASRPTAKDAHTVVQRLGHSNPVT